MGYCYRNCFHYHSLELTGVRARVVEVLMVLVLLLLTEDLELQEELLLLQEPCIGRIHGRRRLLSFLVRRNVLVILQLLHFRLCLLWLFVPVLAVTR